MCVPENTARPASVPKGRAQKAASPSIGKGPAFSDRVKSGLLLTKRRPLAIL